MWEQALEASRKLLALMSADGCPPSRPCLETALSVCVRAGDGAGAVALLERVKEGEEEAEEDATSALLSVEEVMLQTVDVALTGAVAEVGLESDPQIL